MILLYVAMNLGRMAAVVLAYPLLSRSVGPGLQPKRSQSASCLHPALTHVAVVSVIDAAGGRTAST